MILSFLTGTIGRWLLMGGAVMAGLIWLRSEVVAPYKMAVQQEKAACEIRISNLRTDAERTISDIIRTVEDDQTPASESVSQYCEKYPTLCRSADEK